MLINDVVNYCHAQYSAIKCIGCSRDAHCHHDCRICLNDLHFHTNAIRRDYSCEHLLDFYQCRYSWKYCSEILYALENVDLSRYPYFHILSLGCGGAPDLMAFDYLQLPQEVRYWGLDINPSWEKIHNFIENHFEDQSVKFARRINVLQYFKTKGIDRCNVIFIEYLISYFFRDVGTNGVLTWFGELAAQIVANKPADSPMLIVINDVDSINTGRDTFPLLRTEIEKAGMEVTSEIRRRFKPDEYFEGSIQYPSQNNKFQLPEFVKHRYSPAIRCESAQLILEVR